MAGEAEGTVQKIDTKSFSDCIQALDSAISAFAGARAKADTTASRLYESWDSRGREAFQKACKVLLRQLSDEEENLSTIRNSLETVLTSYETWDRESAGSIGKNEFK